MPYAENRGMRIHYVVEGRGSPLVLAHGFAYDHRVWQNVVAALRDEYLLISFDARGHGASDKPHAFAAYTARERAEDVVAVLDAVGVERAHYWGYSMGGWTAYALAAHAPERVRSLVIGAADAGRSGFDAFIGVDGSDYERFVAALEAIVGAPLGEGFRNLLRRRDLRALAAIAQPRPSLESVLPTMTMPCLLYAGALDDRSVDVEACARRMPNAEYMALPGLDHVRAFVRDAALVHVAAFLRHVVLCDQVGRNAIPTPLED